MTINKEKYVAIGSLLDLLDIVSPIFPTEGMLSLADDKIAIAVLSHLDNVKKSLEDASSLLGSTLEEEINSEESEENDFSCNCCEQQIEISLRLMQKYLQNIDDISVREKVAEASNLLVSAIAEIEEKDQEDPEVFAEITERSYAPTPV